MSRDGEKRAGRARTDRRVWGWTAAALGAGAATWAAASALRARRRRERIAAQHPEGPRIVILGAGFGGLTCAAELSRRLPPGPRREVVLVDRHNYQLFTPLLYHAATGLVDPSHILFPVRSLAGIRFYEALIRGVDFSHRRVLLEDGSLEYDQLVIALGSTTNYFGHDEWADCALSLKSLGDSIALRNRIIDCYERADRLPPGPERHALLTFVIVGGGATGVELMGALHGLVRDVLRRHYPRISRDEVRLVLVEALDTLLPGLNPFMGRHAEASFRRSGVDVRLRTSASEVTADGITVQSQGVVSHLPSRSVVWAAGVRPVPVVRALDAPMARDGRLLVDQYLQVLGKPEVYALGDSVAFSDPRTGRFLAPNAAVAVQQGKAVAETIAARLADEEPKPFRYRHLGELVSLGRYDGIAEVLGVRLIGLPAWLLWRAFYLSELMGAKNRLGVAFDWSFAYFYQRDTVQLQCAREREPEPFILPERAVLPATAPREEVEAALAAEPVPASDD